MKVSQWAEIRRLFEREKLSKRAIAERLGCSRRTVDRALCMEVAAFTERDARTRPTKLDPFKPRIQAILQEYPRLSAVRVLEKIAQAEGASPGYTGGVSQLKAYLQSIRPAKGRVYQDISYSPGEAIQVDWGDVGSINIKNTRRRISVFVAVLCYSRMCYIEFTLSQRKQEFYRGTANALQFFGGSPKKIIFDNLKAAVVRGSGRTAIIHPEFLALCGHYCLQPIACAARDPESKGMVENMVRYVKQNALQGRDEELQHWADYRRLAIQWRDEVANVRRHDHLQQRPVDRWEVEKPTLRPLPTLAFDTDETVLTEVRPMARIEFDGNRYTVPPNLVRKTVLLRANPSQLRIFYQGQQVAAHARSFGRRELIVDPQHQLEAYQLRRKKSASDIEQSFAALGEAATEFYLQLCQRPVRPVVHLRRIMELLRLYGRESIVAAIAKAVQYQTCDAAYVETLIHQERRKLSLPSPTAVQPKRQELMDLELDVPDLSHYDRFTKDQDE